MSKYIDADELKKVFRDEEDAEYTRWTLAGVLYEIDDIEAADVQEVRRGRWKYTKELYSDPNGNHLFYGKICSECHNVSPYDSPYCMNCGANMQQGVTLVGAKMDEVERNEN